MACATADLRCMTGLYGSCFCTAPVNVMVMTFLFDICLYPFKYDSAIITAAKYLFSLLFNSKNTFKYYIIKESSSVIPISFSILLVKNE
jgi:hypothetical protein